MKIKWEKGVYFGLVLSKIVKMCLLPINFEGLRSGRGERKTTWIKTVTNDTKEHKEHFGWENELQVE